MRPVKRDRLNETFRICGQYPLAHGEPLPQDAVSLGIRDLAEPDFGDPVEIADDEEPVFWACGVTASMAALSAQLELTICHAPGHMFISDWSYAEAREAGILLGDPLRDNPRIDPAKS
jgi:uncharacterized protein YcsI (UPF0317 family)